MLKEVPTEELVQAVKGESKKDRAGWVAAVQEGHKQGRCARWLDPARHQPAFLRAFLRSRRGGQRASQQRADPAGHRFPAGTEGAAAQARQEARRAAAAAGICRGLRCPEEAL